MKEREIDPRIIVTLLALLYFVPQFIGIAFGISYLLAQ